MKKYKNVIIAVLCFALGASLSIAGTFAFLQDESQSAFNVMTSGKVKIVQLEYERSAGGMKLVSLTAGKPAIPAVYNGSGFGYEDEAFNWAIVGSESEAVLYDDSIGNVIDRFVLVKNTGKNEAYIRTVIAIEEPTGISDSDIHINKNEHSDIAWEDGIYTYIDGVRYRIMVATYKTAVKPGKTTAPSLLQMFLDPSVGNDKAELFGDTWDVLVISQAVQTSGFTAPDGILTSDYALDMAFGDVNAVKNPFQ